MKKNNHWEFLTVYRKLVSIVASNKFFIAVVILFILQSLWIVISSRFALPYDESYHLGAIKAYEQHWLPFISSQNQSDAGLGDITRYGSYFYHYLMSFPARLISFFSDDIGLKIILLRVISVLMLATSLVVFRMLLDRLRISRGVSHVSLLLFSLLPTVLFLAATINYENLFILIAVSHVLIAFETKKRRFRTTPFLLFSITGMLGCLTKYSFIPIFVGTSLYIAVGMYIYLRKRGHKDIFSSIKNQLKKPLVIGLALLTIISAGLFTERYVGNFIAYGSLNPSCEKVQTTSSCSNWGVWERNNQLDKDYPDDIPTVVGYLKYIVQWWVPNTLKYLTLVGGRSETGVVGASISYNLSIQFIYGLGAISALALLFVLTNYGIRRQLRRLLVILVPISIYLAALTLQNYVDFITLGKAVGTQGRYLLWFLPVLGALALTSALFMIRAVSTKPHNIILVTGTVIMLGFSQFAGLTTYFYRSQPSWFWPHNQFVKDVNSHMKKISKTIVVGGKE